MPKLLPSNDVPAGFPYPVSPNYRCGEFGGWTLKRKDTVTTERGYFSGMGNEPSGHYIEHDGHIWMSTSRLERESHAVHLKDAHGAVVVCGVGMGLYLFNIAASPQVDRIIAVDRDPEVIDMVRNATGFDGWVGRDKVTFVQQNALRLTQADLCGVEADYLYVDIWPELGDPNAIADTRAIQSIVAARAVGWWGQELDFMEWACERRPGQAITVEDLRAFCEECGLPMSERSPAYVEGCRRAAEVYSD